MRLIDADALDNELGISDEDINFHFLLQEAPTVDLVEHGHWVEDCRYYDLKCSKCGERSLCYFDEEELDYYLCRSKYCPNCGAKMDEVRE